MNNFEVQYERLNSSQKQAVDTIDGPLLVIAGPGTGKTQLLSARVANILQKTDTRPQNILCLTFTESGAENMRERLTRFIGQAAYDVTISTYHGFGSDIIYRFPQYFTATQLQNPVDQLGKHEILRVIVENLSYANPLKQLRHHLGDLISTVSEVKRALLSPADLRAIADENSKFVSSASKQLQETLQGLATMPRTTAKALPIFSDILLTIEKLDTRDSSIRYGSLASEAIKTLGTALAGSEQTNKTTPLTTWKNKWLAKDATNNYIFDGELENKRISALADVLEAYQNALSARGLYDFDDMITRAIEALETHPELKYSLQEQYLYILLDEFQDTNAAQLKIVELLTDNPVNENRPNVMAVGDDDQAIYAFQGAQYSNMLDFYHLYRDVAVINLTENYRSHQDIISTAGKIANQIELRLHHQFADMRKDLTAAGDLPESAHIIREELTSDVAQYDWISSQIEVLIKTGTQPREIAVLAPKHRYIEPLVAYLNAREIPVQYEKRENILDAVIIKQLLTMSRLVLALHNGHYEHADALWPEVLSYDFWGFPTRDIWEISWQINDTKETNWTKKLLDDPRFTTPALLMTTLALMAPSETCERMIDFLIGSDVVVTREPDTPTVCSPLRDYYTSDQMQHEQPEVFYQAVTELKVLQSKLRDYQKGSGHTLSLPDLIEFVELYEAAEEPMLNTSPYHQRADAVQLMTVFKAKGLEFEHVFLPSCHDNVWGGGSRGNRNNLTLPQNLAPIRHAGATDDERLRILFVAMTRAKFGLYLSSYSHSFSGTKTKRLKYLDEQEQADGSFKTLVLPESYQVVITNDYSAPSLAVMELDWRARHLQNLSSVDLHDLLLQRLQRYRLSPTHLNQFTDLLYAGPHEFLFKTLLRFPQAPTASGQFGNAVHQTLEWLQYRHNEVKKLPSLKETLARFDEYLAQKSLSEQDIVQLTERGHHVLTHYLAKRKSIFEAAANAEANFASEGVFVGPVQLTGKVDRMEIDRHNKTIVVVDYKTGPSHSRWTNTELSLHKYKQQLYCYKLLIEGSHTYAGYTVVSGRLEFIEPDRNGTIHTLDLQFEQSELSRIKQLLESVWQHVTTLDLPDTSGFSHDLKGITDFENWLINTPKH